MIVEIRSDEHEGDGRYVRVGDWGEFEAREKGHWMGGVGIGGERIDEDENEDGFEGWVGEKRRRGEVDGGGELVGVAEARNEESLCSTLFCDLFFLVPKDCSRIQIWICLRP